MRIGRFAFTKAFLAGNVPRLSNATTPRPSAWNSEHEITQAFVN
jgi:hypothetical protein